MGRLFGVYCGILGILGLGLGQSLGFVQEEAFRVGRARDGGPNN